MDTTSTGGSQEERERRWAAVKRLKQRQQQQQRAQEAAQRKVRQRGAPSDPLERKFYIGLYSEEDRKLLFLKYFGLESSRVGPLHRLDTSVEDPYDGASWYNAEELKEVLGTDGVASKFFSGRYAVQRAVKEQAESSTRPDLYEIRSLTEYFKKVLYEREDLFMKIVPLTGVADMQLEEIYNEIIVGYFLNELVYGYSQVLSIHFMTIVDWFPTVRTLETGKLIAPHQVIVSERMDVALHEFLMDNAYLEVLRGALFQLFHALETAWYTNAYTHNDLHMANVMTMLLPNTSALFGKDLLYRRLSSPHWCRVPHGDTNGSIVKIIDFGRNRMHVASQENHVGRGAIKRHMHDRLICIEGTEKLGYGCDLVNRQIDVLLPLLGILSLPEEYWDTLGEEESAAYFAMCERLLPFEELNETVAAYANAAFTSDWLDSAKLAAEYIGVGSRVTAANLHFCPNVMRLLQAPGVFIYRARQTGSTASDVLDDVFFSGYQTMEVLPEGPLKESDIVSVRDQHAVVSFVTHPEEEQHLSSLQASASLAGCCSVCRAPSVTLQTKESGDAFCGRACYEFKYLFGGATVYRSRVYK